MNGKNGIDPLKYYELLEWKDNNLSEFWNLYERGTRLCDLSTEQLQSLYKHITK